MPRPKSATRSKKFGLHQLSHQTISKLIDLERAEKLALPNEPIRVKPMYRTKLTRTETVLNDFLNEAANKLKSGEKPFSKSPWHSLKEAPLDREAKIALVQIYATKQLRQAIAKPELEKDPKRRKQLELALREYLENASLRKNTARWMNIQSTILHERIKLFLLENNRLILTDPRIHESALFQKNVKELKMRYLMHIKRLNSIRRELQRNIDRFSSSELFFIGESRVNPYLEAFDGLVRPN